MSENTFGSRWLSEAAETLVQEIEAAPAELPFHCDVLIVGSGYGGAVAAARLAGATSEGGGDPIRVVVIERGQEYLPGMYPATFAELPPHVRFSVAGQRARGRAEGLFDLRLGGDVNVLLGNGLGGGSLINAAVMERPTVQVFQRPGWPARTTLASLDPWYAKAEAMLQGQTQPESPPKFVSLDRAARAMGAGAAQKATLAVAFAAQRGDPVPPTPAGVTIRDCLRCGDCVTGCNHQAKKSLDTNYLALARANRARLVCGATVHLLSALAGGDGFDVSFHLTDPTKARSDRAPYRLRARRVILAAGAFGSTEILRRSADNGLPIATECVGTRFSGNGDLIAAAYRQRDVAHVCANEGDAPKNREVGPTITGLVRHRADDGTAIVFEEFAIPAPLRRALGDVVATTSALHGLVQLDRSRPTSVERGADPLAVGDKAIEHTMVYGAMGDDGAAGEIVLVAHAPHDAAPHDARVSVTWAGAGNAPLFKSQVAALRRAHESLGGCGGQVLPNPLWHPLPPFDALQDLNDTLAAGSPMTVHPLGGCPMGDDRTRGAVDAVGGVFAAAGADPTACLPGLAVLDGSIVPSALGINPALTIAALAERGIEGLMRRWRLVRRASDVMQTQPRPQWRDTTAPQEPKATVIRLQERMTGALVIDGKHWHAAAVAEFEPVSVRRLRELPRTLLQPHIELTFADPAAPDTVIGSARCKGSAAVLVRETSSPLARVLRVRRLALRRLLRFGDLSGGGAYEFIALCSHLGQVRLIRYDWTVTSVEGAPPVGVDDKLRLDKRIEFVEGGNPWRQLSEGCLSRIESAPVELGRLVLDPGHFVRQLTPLVGIESQQDQPTALGDILEAALWVLRIVLRIHALNFLPPPDFPARANDRLPSTVNGVSPTPSRFTIPNPPPGMKTPPEFLLSRYTPPRSTSGRRPVLLIHGYGAGGSTFAHPSIDHNLVRCLNDAGLEAWVLDLRTSIGLDQRHYWSFDEVARQDVARAVDEVLAVAKPRDGRVDVIAHCIGAAMFSVAVLDSPTLHKKIGSAVLSQVGPLVRMSAFNRFRGYVASYVQQFLGNAQFDTELDSLKASTLLIDALLQTYPYPDDDGENTRLVSVPKFRAVRHRADAIFGQTMELANIGDATLATLNSIYGWVMVKGLAQTIHYAREKLLTDPNGANQVVSFDNLAARMNFPLLMVHGRKNAMFDWRGSYATIRLLTGIFDTALPESPPAGNRWGASQRWLRVFDGYGHQDTLIGQHAHRDVFPAMLEFLATFASATPSAPKGRNPMVVEYPQIGPALGRVKLVGRELTCRLALRPPPSRASVIAVAFVPGVRNSAGGWDFDLEQAVVTQTDRDALIDEAIKVTLHLDQVSRYEGFAVVGVHDDLPPFRITSVCGTDPPLPALFAQPKRGPSDEIKTKLAAKFADSRADETDLAVVHLDPAWIGAAEIAGAARDTLSFALASCQYPAGLIDRAPAQASLDRLAQHIAHARLAERPQFVLLPGDAVYLDELAGLFEPATDAGLIDRSYQQNLSLPAMRRVTKAVPVFTLPDDHEIEDNWEPESPPTHGHQRALTAYRQHWHKLIVDQGGPPPFDQELKPAGFPLFLFDARTCRQPRVLRNSPGGTLLATASIHDAGGVARLLTWLAAQPPDLPKLVVSSVAVFPFSRTGLGEPAERIALDDWSGYPHSLVELLSGVAAKRIANVVLLAGDRHMSSVSSLWLDSSPASIEVISVVSSGLYAPWPFANVQPDELLLQGRVDFANGGMMVGGNLVHGAVSTANGFAVVCLARAGAHWAISVRLDSAAGPLVCGRVIGDAADKQWR